MMNLTYGVGSHKYNVNVNVVNHSVMRQLEREFIKELRAKGADPGLIVFTWRRKQGLLHRNSLSRELQNYIKRYSPR